MWDAVEKGKAVGYLHKVVKPMIGSPIAGFILAFLFMKVVFAIANRMDQRKADSVFGKLQLASSAYMGFAHGMSDAQKTMGIITMALLAATKSGDLANAPAFLQQVDNNAQIWVKITCSLVMAAGTAAGGWKIIRTLGENMVPLRTSQGFGAETTAASLLAVTQGLGMTVSTTHCISTAIMGAGMADGPDKLNMPLIRRIVGAWVLTIPAAGLTAWLCVKIGALCGLISL
jgi:inorganic phosphate transporter, PiT family